MTEGGREAFSLAFFGMLFFSFPSCSFFSIFFPAGHLFPVCNTTPVPGSGFCYSGGVRTIAGGFMISRDANTARHLRRCSQAPCALMWSECDIVDTLCGNRWLLDRWFLSSGWRSNALFSVAVHSHADMLLVCNLNYTKHTSCFLDIIIYLLVYTNVINTHTQYGVINKA